MKDAAVEPPVAPVLDPERIHHAAQALKGRLAPTPTVESPALSELLDAEVFLKCEFASPIGSFKARGALYALLRARERGPMSGAVTSSTGNHGQGVAFAARSFGVPAHIFLPSDPNPEKRDMIERLGARVVIHGADIDEAKDLARAYASEHDLMFVDDGESDDVIYGAGTVGMELRRQAPGLEYCFVPMGSGTLASGVGAAFYLRGGTTKVVAVQSSEAPAMAESFHARRPISRPVRTLAEGLACGVPANLALSGLLRFVRDAITVGDEDLVSAMGHLLRSAHFLVEPAAAAALAGALAVRSEIRGRRVGLVLTGANTTPQMILQSLATQDGVPG